MNWVDPEGLTNSVCQRDPDSPACLILEGGKEHIGGGIGGGIAPSKPRGGEVCTTIEVGGGANIKNLSPSDILRIQNAANRSGNEINLVGSRAGGNARSNSDWDYVINANSKTRNNLSRSLPGSGDPKEGIRPNIDVFKGPVDANKPYIKFLPE